MSLSQALYAGNGNTDREILLRLPYLSEKNGKIITSALKELNGIHSLEACFELRVLIVSYDEELIKNDSIILETINKQELNTTVDKIYSRDIPIIRRDYKITKLISIETKTH